MSNRKSPGKILLVAVEIAVTAAAIVLVSRMIDRRAFLNLLGDIDPALLSLVTGILIIQVILAAFRWRFITRSLLGSHPLPIPASSFVRAFYITQMCGQIMPFVAGDAIRVMLLKNEGLALSTATKSVLIDRIGALLVLFAIALPALLFSHILTASQRYFLPILWFVLAGLAGATAVFLVAKPMARALSKVRLASLVAETIMETRSLMFGKRSAFKLFGYFLLVHACAILSFWMLAIGQHLPLDLVDAAAVVPVILIVAAMPISITGWGVREGLIVVLLSEAGVTAEKALLLSVTFGSVLLLAALPGVLAWFLSRRRKP
jgi:uncharacterized membrane protein YbhN (UPF0104 family)